MIAIGRRTARRLAHGSPRPVAPGSRAHRRRILPARGPQPCPSAGMRLAPGSGAPDASWRPTSACCSSPSPCRSAARCWRCRSRSRRTTRVTFDVYARDVADGDRGPLDLFGASSTSTGDVVAIAAAFVLGALLAGVADRRVHPLDRRRRAALVAGRGAFAKLAVIYLVTGAIASASAWPRSTTTRTAGARRQLSVAGVVGAGDVRGLRDRARGPVDAPLRSGAAPASGGVAPARRSWRGHVHRRRRSSCSRCSSAASTTPTASSPASSARCCWWWRCSPTPATAC